MREKCIYACRDNVGLGAVSDAAPLLKTSSISFQTFMEEWFLLRVWLPCVFYEVF